MDQTEPSSDKRDANADINILARWGLDEAPFAEMSVAGAFKDRFFFPSQQHLRALGFIGQLLWSRANLAIITSSTGMGKSMLIQRLLADLDERVLIAHVQSGVHHDAQGFLLAVLQQFGMHLEPDDRSDRRRLLNRFLTHQYGMNRLCLLVVEDVNAMRPSVLDELREIAALAVDGHRVVKLLLLGGASLHHVVDAPRMAALSDGRAPRLTLDCFSEDQVAAYVVHRLRAAGAEDPDGLMPATLMTSIHRYSAGRPGIINRLCEESLHFAARQNERCVTQAAVDQAANLLGLRPPDPIASPPNNEASGPDFGNVLPVSEQALLILTVQGGADGVIPLLSNRILIGRGEAVDVRIDSAFVSRYHALIVRESPGDAPGATGGRDLLIDLGSTNGVLVNGKRRIRHILKHRDLIQVGPARITYLNPTLAPPMESDASETVSFGRGSADDSDQGEHHAIVGFGRLDEAG